MRILFSVVPFESVGLTAAPKKTLWFCRSCYATDDTVEKKETTETKVDTVLAIACFYLFSVEYRATNG